MEIIKEAFWISTDKAKIDVPFVHHFLTNSYWAKGISLEVVLRSIEGSLVFGLFHQELQVGFARVITDGATFAYLADVFVTEAYRGQGLSKWLMQVITEHPSLQGLRRFVLLTRDAHGLYKQFGFAPITQPEAWMQIHQPDVYKNVPS